MGAPTSIADKIRIAEEIRRDSAYCLPDFMRITHLGWKSIRRAQLEGLKVTKIGNRSYVRGADWLDHLEKKSAAV